MHPYLLTSLNDQHRQELYRSAGTGPRRQRRPLPRARGCAATPARRSVVHRIFGTD